MKITLPNNTTIFIREEDFSEVNVGPGEVSYIRPNGTRAVIRLQSLTSVPKSKIEIPVPEAIKREDQAAVQEQTNTSARPRWRQETPKQQEDLSKNTFRQIDELQKQLRELEASLKSEKADVVVSRNADIEHLKMKYEDIKTAFDSKVSDMNVNMEKIDKKFEYACKKLDRRVKEIAAKGFGSDFKFQDQLGNPT